MQHILVTYSCCQVEVIAEKVTGCENVLPLNKKMDQ